MKTIDKIKTQVNNSVGIQQIPITYGAIEGSIIAGYNSTLHRKVHNMMKPQFNIEPDTKVHWKLWDKFYRGWWHP